MKAEIADARRVLGHLIVSAPAAIGAELGHFLPGRVHPALDQSLDSLRRTDYVSQRSPAVRLPDNHMVEKPRDMFHLGIEPILEVMLDRVGQIPLLCTEILPAEFFPPETNQYSSLPRE